MEDYRLDNIDKRSWKYSDIKYWINPKDNTCNATIVYDDKLSRLRAAMLIIKGDEILLGEEADELNRFSLPGGGLEKGESPLEAAIREAQEEVHINVKNAIDTRIDYCECHDEVKEWVKQNVPEEEWWFNYYTCLCIGKYDSEYEGKVDKVDQDKHMLKSSKWYKISDVINDPSFKYAWKKALADFGYIDQSLVEKIVKKGSQYQVQSENGRNMGTYSSLEQAKKRLNQIEYFKHMNEDKEEKLYHVSEKPLTHTMHPEIPESDYEEQETPRICFAKTIQGCLIGAYENEDITGKTLHVYSTVSDYYQPTKEEVADVEVTGEVWVLHDVDPTYEYDIKITGTDESKAYDINGNEFEIPIWNYEIIDDLEESLENTAYVLRNDGKLFKAEQDEEFTNIHPIFEYHEEDGLDENLKHDLEYYLTITSNDKIKTSINEILNNQDIKENLKVVKDYYVKECSEIRIGGDRVNRHQDGSVYFRYWPTGFNWFNNLWHFVVENKQSLRDITIEKYKSANIGDYELEEVKINNKLINHMPIDEFIVLEGNPILEAAKVGYPRLYHKTGLNTILKIIQEDTIKIGGSYWYNIQNGQCVCFSRSFTFVKNMPGSKFGILVINRDKLAADYKIIPMSDDKNNFDGATMARYESSKAEEVVKENITNMHKYLDKIIIEDAYYNSFMEFLNKHKNELNTQSITFIKMSEYKLNESVSKWQKTTPDSILTEATRAQMVAGSKNADLYKHPEFGKNRWERKRLSKVSKSTKTYNQINMNDLWKSDLLTVKVPVTGETGNYEVEIQLSGVVAELQKAIKNNNNVFEYKVVIQSVTKVFNSGQVKISCNCDDYKYRYKHAMILRGDSTFDSAQDPGAGKTSMANTHGFGCKHCLAVLANQTWLVNVSNVCRSYILYMAEHEKALFNKLIFPKLYGTTVDDVKEDELVPEDTNLKTDKNIIDTINTYARDKGKFKKGSNKNTTSGKLKLGKEEEK